MAIALAHESRARGILAQRVVHGGVEMIELRLASGDARAFGAPELSKANPTLPLGAVAQHGRFRVVVQKTPATHTTVEGLL